MPCEQRYIFRQFKYLTGQHSIRMHTAHFCGSEGGMMTLRVWSNVRSGGLLREGGSALTPPRTEKRL